MSDLGNKSIIAQNIKYYMSLKGVTQTEVCTTLNIKANTFSDWVNAKTYPRIDKIEMLANYFGIEKSDLIEKSSNPVDPDIRRIERARQDMTQKEREEMMKVLEISFKKYFTDNFVDTTDYSDEDD